jgi:hypothetical protein
VFVDTSFAGDPRYAKFVFDGRRAQLDVWQEIADSLERIRVSGRVDVEMLDALLSDMDASIARHGEDIVRKTFRTNLWLRIRDIRAGRAAPSAVLMDFLNDANRNVAAATAHLPH